MVDREDKLTQLFDALCDLMIHKLKDKSAKPGDLREIRQFLNDNGIDITKISTNKVNNIVKLLPFTEIDEVDETEGDGLPFINGV